MGELIPYAKQGTAGDDSLALTTVAAGGTNAAGTYEERIKAVSRASTHRFGRIMFVGVGGGARGAPAPLRAFLGGGRVRWLTRLGYESSMPGLAAEAIT